MIYQQNGAGHAGPSQVTVAFDDVHIAFGRNAVLRGVTFELHRGQTKVLLGIAGSGKSTILKLAMGLLKPDSGQISVLGTGVSATAEEELFDLRRNIGMVFQEGALFDSLTVENNVAYRLHEEGVPREESLSRVVEALRFVELEHTLEKLPSQLSGGMRRRVAIARAIVTNPEVILYDSPTGGLDPITSTRIIELIVKQRDVSRTTALVVTHRIQDAFLLAASYWDKEHNEMRTISPGEQRDTHTGFMLLRDGRITFDGSARELADSRDEFIREYIS